VGADLCTPVVDAPEHEPLRVLESQISYLEEQIESTTALYRRLNHLCFHQEPRLQRTCMLPERSCVARSEGLGRQSMLSVKA
ncbi:MAG: hypothetical protein RLZZ99_755, partial [Actinomycetota bacterium]